MVCGVVVSVVPGTLFLDLVLTRGAATERRQEELLRIKGTTEALKRCLHDDAFIQVLLGPGNSQPC